MYGAGLGGGRGGWGGGAWFGEIKQEKKPDWQQLLAQVPNFKKKKMLEGFCIIQKVVKVVI